MATSYGNTLILQYTTQDSYPLSKSLTGTVSAVTPSVAIIGVGTLFTTEIGGYNGNDLTKPNTTSSLGSLWDVTNGEWRNIVSVESNTLLFIAEPFSNTLVGATVKYIPASRVRSIAFTDTGAGTGNVDGVALVANEGGGWQQIDYIDKPIDPHLFTNVTVTVSFT